MKMIAVTLAALCCASVCAGRAYGGTPVPSADAVALLRAYDPKTGDPVALMQAVVPKLAPVYLKLAPGAEIQKGGPLSALFTASLPAKLDASPGDLPIVVYKKEDGRLPAAFILARYRGAQPQQMFDRMLAREGIVKHPLVAQYFELEKAKAAEAGPWGDGATRKLSTGFYAVNMPFGAGIFGLRPSYIMGEWESVLLPNGVAVLSYMNRPARPDEKQRMASFQDKKDRQQKLDDDYYEGQEYCLTSVLIPERDESGQVKNTVDVYFVRIVPALKPGTDLKGSGPLARWLFTRGAAEALITPVKLIRDEVKRLLQGR